MELFFCSNQELEYVHPVTLLSCYRPRVTDDWFELMLCECDGELAAFQDSAEQQ